MDLCAELLQYPGVDWTVKDTMNGDTPLHMACALYKPSECRSVLDDDVLVLSDSLIAALSVQNNKRKPPESGGVTKREKRQLRDLFQKLKKTWAQQLKQKAKSAKTRPANSPRTQHAARTSPGPEPPEPEPEPEPEPQPEPSDEDELCSRAQTEGLVHALEARAGMFEAWTPELVRAGTLQHKPAGAAAPVAQASDMSAVMQPEAELVHARAAVEHRSEVRPGSAEVLTSRVNPEAEVPKIKSIDAEVNFDDDMLWEVLITKKCVKQLENLDLGYRHMVLKKMRQVAQR